MQGWHEMEENVIAILIGLVTGVSLVLMVMLASINILGAIMVVGGMIFADSMLILGYLYDPLFSPLGDTQGE